MASFFKFKRRLQASKLPDVYYQKPHRHFHENQCRVLGEQISIAKDISSDHTLCPQSALPELQRVVKLGETLIEGCQNETCAHKAYLRQDERTKAFEETLKEILWCISVVFYSKRICLSGGSSVLAIDEFPQAILGAKEQYVLQKAALADEKVLRAALDIWIEEHECSVEECGRPQRQSGALCLAAQILNRRGSNGEGPAPIELVDDVEADHKSSLWITVQKSLEDVVQIGKGSLGTVFETKWLGDTFAKKEFDTHCKDFADEANALAKLSHPHIVKVYTACSDFCIPCFFLMEKMPYNLRTHMNWRMNRLGINPPFSISAGIDLMLQISEAMNYMNSQGMVHRDLKAENILVKPLGDPELWEAFVIAKLADFGLAKVKHEVTSRMKRNTGTRRWMAPEVLGVHLDDEENWLLQVFPRKADVYSFGIVCSEILTGNAPFYNVSYKPRELYKLLTKPDNPLRPELPQTCPESLASLIRECWNTDPVIRPTFKEISMTLRYFKGLLMMGGGGELMHFESASWHTLRATLGTPFSTADMVQTQWTFGNNTAETKFASARDQIEKLKEKLDRQISLKDDTQSTTELEEELEIVKETMEREAEDNKAAQAEYRSKIEKLEEQVSTLTSAKSTLETQVAQSETKIDETERLLHATEIKGLRIELSKEKAEVERLQAEMDELSKIGQEASLKMIDLEEARDELEARSAALIEDKKRASAKASELGEEILKLETECKELNQRFGEMNTKYLEIVAERDEVQQENRNLRNK